MATVGVCLQKNLRGLFDRKIKGHVPGWKKQINEHTDSDLN